MKHARDDADDTHDERAAKRTRHDVSEGPFASLFPELWNEVGRACGIKTYGTLAQVNHTIRRAMWRVQDLVEHYVASTSELWTATFSRFVAEECDVPTLFHVDARLFAAALARTKLAAQVRPWLTGAGLCTGGRLDRDEGVVDVGGSHNGAGIAIAGGAARAAILEALRICGVPGLARELTEEYSDVDFWVDLHHVAWPLEFATHVATAAQDTPVKVRGVTVLATASNIAQFCAWDSTIGHKADCAMPHDKGVTPIGCFDLTAVQFALTGRWFEEATEEGRKIPCTAWCTRMAAYSLVTRRCYTVGVCLADEWLFRPEFLPLPRSFWGDGEPSVFSTRTYRLLTRALKLVGRGHVLMKHTMGCSVGLGWNSLSIHFNVTERQRRGHHVRVKHEDGPALGRAQLAARGRELMDLDRVRLAVALPGNAHQHNTTPDRPAPLDDGYTSVLGVAGLRCWNAALRLLANEASQREIGPDPMTVTV